ncbi:MAG: archaemetzincin family Zn-dependent metalloprotease [Methanobacteriales archaeon]|nr:archaemetzincin family Zn-dependent metalloprotease [Methanobacteriales archaeon]
MILIQAIGKIEGKILEILKNCISKILNTKVIISSQFLDIPEHAYNPLRGQYNSTKILLFLKSVIKEDFDHILGITDADLYAPGLNFVFGEAESPGKFAIISLYRLKHPDKKIFVERMLKEAIHELGHTFGLAHCNNPSCVMYFSNSIIDTDKKTYMFCKKCLKKLKLAN